MQQNWIGKSFGCEIDFEIIGDPNIIKRLNVLRLDQTLFLVFLFLALSIDHPISKLYADDKDFKQFKE